MSEIESEGDGCTPEELKAIALKVTDNLLLEKSKKAYQKSYDTFITWKLEKKAGTFSETVMLAYFEELGNKFAPSTLWTEYSMLKSTINLYHQTDISKYCKLRTMLKRKSEGFRAKKSKTFQPDDIKKFIIEAPDFLYLFSKVAVIFGVMGACRRQEMHNLKYDDVKDHDTTLLVQLFNTKNKLDRAFTITGNYYSICKKYMDLRPNPCKSVNFFIRCSKGKCVDQNVGINTFGNMGKTVAKYLNLSEPHLYTGHCFRRTSATLSIDSGGDITDLKRHGGWKSTTVAEGYIDTSIQTKMKVSQKLMSTIDCNRPSTSTSGAACRPGNSKVQTQEVLQNINESQQTATSSKICTTTAASLNVQDTTSTVTDKVTEDAQPGPSKILDTRTPIDSGGRPQDPLSQVVQQCRFCGEFSNDCVAVSSDMTYLAGNKTTLALNDASVQLDFNDRSRPKTVCRHCDAKLQEFCDFVNVVKAAQCTLISVVEEKEQFETGAEYEEKVEYEETETVMVKMEYESEQEDSDDDKEGILDYLSVGETVFAKETHKRKSDTDTAKPKKLKAKEKCEDDLVIDIKEEVVEKDANDGCGVSEVSDTGTDVKPGPSRLELTTSALVFEMAGDGTSEYQGYRSHR